MFIITNYTGNTIYSIILQDRVISDSIYIISYIHSLITNIISYNISVMFSIIEIFLLSYRFL